MYNFCLNFQLGQESLSEDIFLNENVLDDQEDVSLWPEESSGAEDVWAANDSPVTNCDSCSEIALLLQDGKPNDTSLYSTLSSNSSDVFCLLSNDVPSSIQTINCPEGILIDLGKAQQSISQKKK